MTAQRLCDEAIPPGRAAALVVLNGSSTGQDAPADGSDASRLPGLARTLVERSVPAVIATQAPVGNRYATDLMGCVYEELASWQEPRPLAALGHARRTLPSCFASSSTPTLLRMIFSSLVIVSSPRFDTRCLRSETTPSPSHHLRFGLSGYR